MFLYTIGYEGRTLHQLMKSLAYYSVDTVVDVREKAGSRNRDFNKRRLRQHLEGEYIKYIHIPQMGTPKPLRKELKSTGDYQKFFAEIENLLQGKSEELAQILKLIESGRKVALLCLEKDHNKCHRSVVAKLVSEKSDNGIRIMPIL
jgi:uncharacterized protein (DUF488 family)